VSDASKWLRLRLSSNYSKMTKGLSPILLLSPLLSKGIAKKRTLSRLWFYINKCWERALRQMKYSIIPFLMAVSRQIK
jgi:hypothetical protein